MSAPVAGLCLGCGEAVTETLGGAIHLDGFYTCTTGATSDGDGFAELGTFWDLEQKAAEAREDGYNDGYEKGADDSGCREDHDQLQADARHEALQDVMQAVERL
ncbi:hypothetical protein SEA_LITTLEMUNCHKIN_53 [Gordonia phage LittleMunchkin]|nr:hypothetical protein SEA_LITTLEMUNCHKIN_53 [Gordonia phage LittleMunchkin]